MRKRLNDRLLRCLPRHPEKRFDLYDTETSALCLRVNPNGRRTWTYRYSFRGQRPRATLGHHPSSHPEGVNRCHQCLSVTEARNAALAIDGMVARGIDPAEAQKRVGWQLITAAPSPQGPSFGEIAESYLERKRGLASGRHIERLLCNQLLPAKIADGRALAEVAIGELSPRHVHQILALFLEQGFLERAKTVRKQLYGVCELAREMELIEMNPVSAVKGQSLGASEPRTRHLRDWEIAKMWEIWSDAQAPLAGAVVHKLALLTLARPGEILGMEWERVKAEPEGGGSWHLPKTKNRHEHTVYLTPLAFEVLEELRESIEPGRWVFPGQDPSRPRREVQAAKKAFEQAGREVGVDPWQLRDLRATGATGMSKLGIPEAVIGVCQNHAPRGITGRVYIRHKARMWPEARAAWQQWGEHVERVVLGEAPAGAGLGGDAEATAAHGTASVAASVEAM